MARESRPGPTGHRILVVDDQEEVLISVRTLLERKGHTILTADSGARALEVFAENDVHLLLVDYFMPRMTGEELIREIRKLDPYVQIILQTGYSGEKPANEMMAELDIQGYHDKADGPDKLVLWVDVGLKAHRLINQVRDRERVQRELISNVSHEFRTPLNIIGGYMDLLLHGEFGDVSPNASHALTRVATATTNLSDLVADLLGYGKLEVGLEDGVPKWLPMDDIAAELQRLAGLLLENRDVTFTVDLADAPQAVLTDSVKLKTILRNLVTNAIKFTREGAISLRVWSAADTVRFAVQDTGVGVAVENQRLIFEAFRQLDGSTTREYRGIGLGLALSRKLARILGGDIQLESEPGVGSTFTLTLPAVGGEVVAQDPEPESSQDAPAEGEDKLSSKTAA